ncbi:MAG: hypothetical protein IKG46_08960 [Solobacterium sp.]|nr:hypothetical protein [Solobacterium sp.]
MNRPLTPVQAEWKAAREELIHELQKLGYPADFGTVIAKNLGSPKAIRRMCSYVRQVRPKKPEMIADEMLAIMSEVDAWKRKKEAEAANAAYNDLLLRGLEDD